MALEFLLPWSSSFAPQAPQRIGVWRAGLGYIALHRSSEGWQLIGGQEVADRLDALVQPGLEREFWNDFFETVRSWPEALELPNLSEDSPALELADPSWQRELTDRSPHLLLPATFDDYLAGLTKKDRHELKRKLRRAHELHYRSCQDGQPQVWNPALAEFLRLHRLSRRDKESFMTPAMERFFRVMTQAFAERGQMRLGLLEHQGSAIGAMLQFDFGGRVHLYNSGYDPAFANDSPGLVTLAHCIRDAIALGRQEYDFLRGTERYKYDLGGRDRAVVRLRRPPQEAL